MFFFFCSVVFAGFSSDALASRIVDGKIRFCFLSIVELLLKAISLQHLPLIDLHNSQVFSLVVKPYIYSLLSYFLYYSHLLALTLDPKVAIFERFHCITL